MGIARVLHYVTLLGAFTALALAAQAQDLGATLASIHALAQAEIEAARLAEVRGSTSEVRNLGKLALRDDSELDRRLLMLAARNGMRIASVPPVAPHQLTELHTSSGADFDRKFLVFSYGASKSLREAMENEVRRDRLSPLSRLVNLFSPIIRQHEFLSGWCLGHCLPAVHR
jgi:predicted outer membrane protein